MSLRDKLATGEFTITAELSPPRGASAAAMLGRAELLRGWVDAVNITDNQGSHVRLASWAGAVAVQQSGIIEPIMQMTCRDRNRIALQSDLLGAGALGIENLLFMSGDHPKFGDHPGAKPVFDLDSTQLVWTARTLRDEAKLISGKELNPAPRFFLGAVENPFAPPVEYRAQRAAKKIAAGAQFIQTQYVFDLPVFTQWMTELGDLGVLDRCAVLAGVGVIRSVRMLDFLASGKGARRADPRAGGAQAARGRGRRRGRGGREDRRRGDRDRPPDPRRGRRPPAHRRVREADPGTAPAGRR